MCFIFAFSLQFVKLPSEACNLKLGTRWAVAVATPDRATADANGPRQAEGTSDWGSAVAGLSVLLCTQVCKKHVQVEATQRQTAQIAEQEQQAQSQLHLAYLICNACYSILQ